MCGLQVLVVNVKALVMHKLVCANQRVQSICLRSETSVLEQEITTAARLTRVLKFQYRKYSVFMLNQSIFFASALRDCDDTARE